jgi:hypothetical protein
MIRELPIVGGIAQGAIGGAASVLGGGKFENGAITSAFQYMYNHLLHQNTSAANGFHRRVLVQDIPNNYKFGFSFGMNDAEGGNPFLDNLFKGSFSGEPRSGVGNGNGTVYVDMNDPATKTVDVFYTTRSEDMKIINYMATRIGDTAPYNAFVNSCRNFSGDEYEKIKAAILESRKTGKEPNFDR